MDNIVKAHTTNKTGRITFYVFELTGLVLGCILFILGIVVAAINGQFLAFVQNFIYSVVALLLFFAAARIIDLLYVISEKKCECNCGEKCECDDDCDCKKNDEKEENK